jgi:release factor glutamine methyltransferase
VTVNDCVNDAAGVLVRAGFDVEEARRDTAVLARHILGWTLATWAASARDSAPADLSARLERAIRRRATREPVAYITGVREFYGRNFHVTPAVLIPRPETEGLVEAALAAIAETSRTSGVNKPVVVDVGTGSGCIAISIALACPTAQVTATDVSTAALRVATENAHQLHARVIFTESSLLPPEPAAIDIIVSNPPYIPASDLSNLPADVRDFEPDTALLAGADGLDVIRALTIAARARLKPDGSLLMEIGQGQSSEVGVLIRASGLHLERIVPDLQGIPRVVIARQPPTGT